MSTGSILPHDDDLGQPNKTSTDNYLKLSGLEDNEDMQWLYSLAGNPYADNQTDRIFPPALNGFGEIDYPAFSMTFGAVFENAYEGRDRLDLNLRELREFWTSAGARADEFDEWVAYCISNRRKMKPSIERRQQEILDQHRFYAEEGIVPVGSTVAQVGAPGSVSQEPAAEPGESGLPWGPSDTSGVLSGETKRRIPEVVSFTDGSSLLYEGKIHTCYAPSETGKSWLMFAAVVDVLTNGGDVLHVDAEMDVFDCIEILRRLGVSDSALRDQYWHIPDMDNPAVDSHSLKRWEWLLKQKPWGLVVMDSVGQLMGGMDNNSAAEYREWHRLMPDKAKQQGCTVLMIDHISKTQELQGNIGHPEGSTNKKNQVDVAFYLRKVGDGLEMGKVGELELIISKDRFGTMRKMGVPGAKGFKKRGTFRLDSTDSERSLWSLEPPVPVAAVDPGFSDRIQRTGALDQFDASVGLVNAALAMFLDDSGEGVTRSELMEGWHRHAPQSLRKHRESTVKKSESGLNRDGQRLSGKLSSRLKTEANQETLGAMIQALQQVG